MSGTQASCEGSLPHASCCTYRPAGLGALVLWVSRYEASVNKHFPALSIRLTRTAERDWHLSHPLPVAYSVMLFQGIKTNVNTDKLYIEFPIYDTETPEAVIPLIVTLSSVSFFV